MKTLLTSILFCFFIFTSVAQESFQQKLQTQVDLLNDSEPKAIMGIAKLSLSKEVKNPILKKEMIYLVSLGFMKHKYKGIGTYLKQIEKTDGPESLQFLKGGDFLTICSTCLGSGENERACRPCGGKGLCPNAKCQGGEIVYTIRKHTTRRPCPTCKQKGICRKCDSGYTSKKCRTCKKGLVKNYDSATSLLPEAKQDLQAMLKSLAAGQEITANTQRQERLKAKTLALNEFRDKSSAKRKKNTSQRKENFSSLVAKKKDQPVSENPRPQENNTATTINISDDDLNNTDSTPTYLAHTLDEFNDYLKAQFLRSGVKIADKLVARPPIVDENGNKTTLKITISDNFKNNGGYETTCEGLAQFWSLRCDSNGVTGKKGTRMQVLDNSGAILLDLE